MSANILAGRSPTPRWLILFVIVDALIVLSIIGWVAVRNDGSSARQRVEKTSARQAVMASSPEELAAAVLEAAGSQDRVAALSALASRSGLSDADLAQFVASLDEALGDASVLDVSVLALEPGEKLEYEQEGVRYAPNLPPEGRIRLHQADLTHTSMLFGRDSDGYRIVFAAPVR